ncbi:MAG TPA: cupin domain-containing protein [Thermoleophilaceae bacterium]|jgi:mannose-6-phosphate isomerase-like protein (cupin superfamily)
MRARHVVPLDDADTGVLHGRVGTFRILLDEVQAGVESHALLVNTMRAGAKGDEHQHAESDQSMYVLSGTGTLHVGGKPHRVGPHMALFIPASAQHRIEVDPYEDLTYVVVYAPAGPEQLLRANGERAFESIDH